MNTARRSSMDVVVDGSGNNRSSESQKESDVKAVTRLNNVDSIPRESSDE